MALSKGLLGIAAAALVATSIAAPADARGRRHHHRHHDDVDVRDVIAGAVIAGGIAAIASSISRAKRERKDSAVGDCSDEAEYRSLGRVSEILIVSKRRGYYTVEGIADGQNGEGLSFLCTVRNGRIYNFQTGVSES